MKQAIFSKHLADCEAFEANDGCLIKELLHPKNDPVDLPYSFAVATVDIGKSTYRHTLKQTEIYFILEGQGKLHVGAKNKHLTKGESAIVPADLEQWIENTGSEKLEFIVIVSPPWHGDDDLRT